MEKINVLLDVGTEILKSAQIPQARKEARLLLQYALKLDTDSFFTYIYCGEHFVPKNPYLSWIKRRASHEPFAYICKSKEFWSLPFSLSKETLIPRPDSEILIDSLCQIKADKDAPLNILDLGTGSGCLLVAALSEYQKSYGIGIDKNIHAACVAQSNVSTHHLTKRADIIISHWDSALAQNLDFDVILCNPPYIPTKDMQKLDKNVKNYEPLFALDGGEDGLDAYRYLFSRVQSRLNSEGIALFEMGIYQKDQLIALAKENHLRVEGIFSDLGSIERVIALRKLQ